MSCRCNDKKYVEIKFAKLKEDAIEPRYAIDGDSGMDVFIPTDLVPFELSPFERVLIKTGLKMKFQSGYEVQVRSKSGKALKHGLVVLNSPGTIEFTYQGEIGVILFNASKEPIMLEPGMAIAQLCLVPIVNTVNSNVEIKLVKEEELFDSKSERGEGGFGSTEGR